MRVSGSASLALLLLVCGALLSVSAARRQLPESLRDRQLFCETCYAVTTEMYQIIKTTPEGSLEERIDGALRRVCSPELLGRYAFPADLLTASCRDLIVRFENDLGLGLMATFQPEKKPRAGATVKDICVSRMKACKKTSAIPSLHKSNETGAASKTPSGTAPATANLPSPPPGSASALTPDRDITEGRPADGSSGSSVSATAEQKDEL